MSDSRKDEQQALEQYLAEKAKQEQESQQQQETESLSEYEACVLKESTKIHELVAEARKDLEQK